MLYYLVCSVVAYFIARYINARLPNRFTAVWSTLLAVIVGMGAGILITGVLESFDFAINKKSFFRSILQSFWLCVFAAIAGVSQGRKEAAKKESGSPQTDAASKPPLPQSAEPALPASPAPQHVADDAVIAPPGLPFAPEPTPRPTAKDPDTIQTRQTEEALYEIAMSEIAVRRVKKGLWAKAYAQCEGDPNRTKALYIKLRVQALKDEAAPMAQQADPSAEEVESERMQLGVPPASEEWQDQSRTFLDSKAHPWRRFFARVIDNCIAVISLLLLFHVVFHTVPEKHAVGLILLLIFPSLFAEVLFLHWFGTTPAKWLFGIRVEHPDGTLLSFVESLKRLFLLCVWVGSGMMMAILVFVSFFYPNSTAQFSDSDIVIVGLVIIIANCLLWCPFLFAYRRLTKTCTTRWDSAVNAVVVHKKWGVFRALMCITCSVAFLAALSWLNTLNRLGELGLYEKIDRENVRQKYEHSQSQNKKYAAQGAAQENDATEVDKKASSGDADAQAALDMMNAEGRSVQQEQVTSGAQRGVGSQQRALEQAAAQGDSDAQFVLGAMYSLGKGVQQDYKQARFWYEQAAAQGSELAQFSLGRMYHTGRGVRQDYAQARSWYEKAAAQGNAKAQAALGVMYHLAEGVQQDFAKARYWYEKSAAQGVADAQVALGALYYAGQGVQQNYAQARRWFEKSAAQENALAQFLLGAMYAKGEGVLQDEWEAKEWFSKACDAGFQDGCDKYQELEDEGY